MVEAAAAEPVHVTVKTDAGEREFNTNVGNVYRRTFTVDGTPFSSATCSC